MHANVSKQDSSFHRIFLFSLLACPCFFDSPVYIQWSECVVVVLWSVIGRSSRRWFSIFPIWILRWRESEKIGVSYEILYSICPLASYTVDFRWWLLFVFSVCICVCVCVMDAWTGGIEDWESRRMIRLVVRWSPLLLECDWNPMLFISRRRRDCTVQQQQVCIAIWEELSRKLIKARFAIHNYDKRWREWWMTDAKLTNGNNETTNNNNHDNHMIPTTAPLSNVALQQNAHKILSKNWQTQNVRSICGKKKLFQACQANKVEIFWSAKK